MEIADWLRGLGLEKYAPAFADCSRRGRYGTRCDQNQGGSCNAERRGRPRKRRSRISLFTSQVDSKELIRRLLGREEPKGGKRSAVIPYGDPKSSSRFCPAWYFAGLIGSLTAGKALTSRS